METKWYENDGDGQSSEDRVPPGPLSSNNLEQVIYTRAAQANLAFHPSDVASSWYSIATK